MKDLFGLGVLEPTAFVFLLNGRPIFRAVRDQSPAHGLKLRVGGHDGRVGTKHRRNVIGPVGQVVYLLPVAAAFFHDLSPRFNHVGLASVLAGDLLGFFILGIVEALGQDFYYCFRYVLAILMPCDGGY